MEIRQKVKDLFERLDVERPEVHFEPGPAHYRIVLVVVSPSFETMEECDRQSLVWGAILDELTDYEQRAIDTVFTFSPTEYAKLVSGHDQATSPSVP